MSVYFSDDTLTLHIGNARDVLATMDAGSVNCVVTSPPYYGLRDYEGNPDQIGLEETPAEYVSALVGVFAEAHRVLADDGTLWLNLGDSYSASDGPGNVGSSSRLQGGGRPSFRRDGASVATPRRALTGLPTKNMFGIPWQVAFALQGAGWILRNDVIWHKPNAMPESPKDRLTNRHEHLFLLSKGQRYWFDLDTIREPKTGQSSRGDIVGRNPGDVWRISTRPLPEAHFAAFPVELPQRCIAAGCKPGGVVLDPFSGAGTTALAAQQLGRRAIGIDINANYHDIALRRMSDAPLPLLDGEAS